MALCIRDSLYKDNHMAKAYTTTNPSNMMI